MKCYIYIYCKIYNNCKVIQLLSIVNILRESKIDCYIIDKKNSDILNKCKYFKIIKDDVRNEKPDIVIGIDGLDDTYKCRHILIDYSNNSNLVKVEPDIIIENNLESNEFKFYRSLSFYIPIIMITPIYNHIKNISTKSIDSVIFKLYNNGKKENLYNDIDSFLTNMLSCNIIHTDNHIGLSIAILLHKDVRLYNPNNKQEEDKINLILDIFNIKLYNDKIIYPLNYSSIVKKYKSYFLDILYNREIVFNENKLDILNEKAITSYYFKKRLLLDNIKYGFIYNLDKKDESVDMALIQCCYCIDVKQYLAIKRAVEINLKYNNYKIKEWIFIEAGLNNRRYFEYLKDYGIQYYWIELTENQKFLFVKENLWNIGAKKCKSKKLCFLDSDVYYCDCDWFKKTCDALDSYDLLQNFSYSFRENCKDSTSIELGCVCASMNINNLQYCLHTGYNISITRELYESINRIPCCSTIGGDAYFWNYFIINKKKTFSPYNLTYLDEKGYIFNSKSKINIGYVDQYCFHVNHYYNNMKDNLYYIKKFVSHKCNSRKFEDIKYTDDRVEWNTNNSAKVHKALVSRKYPLCSKKMELMYLENKIENCIEEENIKQYGDIDKDNKLLIVTCFNKSIQLDNTDIVKKFKDLYDKYLLTPHSFVCLTNEKINGIDCIEIRNNKLNYNCQYEIFRNDYHDNNTSILYLDLDVIPINYFKLCRCPKNTIYLIDEHDITHTQVSKFNGGSMFYNGDYQCIYDYIDKTEDINYYYNMLQDFTVHSILKYDVNIENLYKFLSIDFVYLNDSNYETYKPKMYNKLIHFTGPIKPWNLTSRFYKVFNNILPQQIFNYLNS